MRLPKKNQGISSLSLRFLSAEQADAYDKMQGSKIWRIRWQMIIQHLLHCFICSCLFVFSKFNLKLFLMAICSFLCAIFLVIPLRRLRSLYMFSLLISRACLIASVLLFFKGSLRSYEGITSGDLYFIGGITVFLSISQYQQWVVKILAAGTSVFLFIVLFQLGSSSYIIGSLALISFAADVYITEKDKRENFLKMEKNRSSLQNWEKFMDTNFSDSFFALAPAPIRKRHSSIRVSDSQIDPSSFVARMKIMKYAKSSFNNNRNRSGDEENVQVSIVPQGIELRVDRVRPKNNPESPNPNNPPDMILEEQPDNNNNLPSEDFRVEFQNIACQKEFYQKGNQREYLLSELKSIVVAVPMSQTIEFLINQEDLPNLSQGTEKIPRQQTSIFQGRSNATANFIPAPIATIDGSYPMLSNGQISIAEGRSQQKKSQVSLSCYLAKYVMQLQNEDPRWISFENGTDCEIEENNSADQLEEDNYFEATELDVLYNCHRITTTPLGSTKKYYQAQILKCIFKGKRVLMCILKDITEKQTSRYNRFVELSKDRLLQSLARDIKSPLIKLASCFESLNTFEDPLKSENGVLLSSQVLSKKKSLESAQQYLLQANYQTSDIVDLLSIINGTIELNKKFFLVHSLVADLTKIYQNELKDRKITLEINCLVDPSERIFTDFQRLKQVLVNLLSLSLQYVVEGTVSLSLSFYDTKKETIEIILVLKDSVLPTHILKQLSKSFSQFDQKFESLQSGKTLQLLLCSALIERIGPTQAFTVSQDDRNAEIRFKIFSNLMNDSRQFESRTQFISFNRENGYLGDSFMPKKQLATSTSNALTKKNLRGFSNQLIDITLSETSSPQKIAAARAFQYFQPIKITQLQSFQQIIASPPKVSISQEDKVIFESACLLTEEIMERQQAETDQAASKIPRENNSANKQKTMIDNNNNNQNLGGGTTPKIRSTAETFEIDLVEDIRRFFGNSKILLIDPDSTNCMNLQNLLVRISSIDVEDAPDCRRALRKIIESESNPYEQKPYRLIILNISTQQQKGELENAKIEGQSHDIDMAGQAAKEENNPEQLSHPQDSKEHEHESEKTSSALLAEYKKIQNYMRNVIQVSPIPLIITYNPQQQDECQQCCEEVGALGSLQLPLTLDSFTRALSKQPR